MRYQGALVRLLVFAFVTILLTALLARTIQGFQDDASEGYAALFTDATRLQTGDDVRLAGVTVGRVRSVTLTDDALAKVSFTVADTVRMTTASTAVIRYRNLIGERYLALEVPAAGDPLRTGDVLPVDRTRPALDLTSVFNGFRPLFQGLDSRSINALSLSLIRALQGEGGTISSLLGSTGSLGRTIGERDRTIGRLVTDLTTVLRAVNTRTGSFDRLVENLQRFTGGLAKDRDLVLDALAGIDDLAVATNSLLTQARPGLAGTVRGVRAIADKLAAGRDDLDAKVNLLPVKLNAIMRSAQYGSWFQFYNCGIGLQVNLLGDQPPLAIPPSGPTTGICGG